MHLRVETVGSGLHPNEVVVSVETKDGREELSIDRTSLAGCGLEVGWPVGQDQDHFLVELPTETFRGFWRVWVPKSDVTAEPERMRA